MQRPLDIITELKEKDRLPLPSDAVLDFINATAYRDPSASQLAALLSEDRAIGDKLIQVANSASLFRGRTIDTVEGALVRIGMLQAIPLVMGLSLITNTLSDRHETNEFEEKFWIRTLGTASIMQAFAQTEKGRAVPDTTYFACGIFLPLGELIFFRYFGEDYHAFWSDHLGKEPDEIRKAEHRKFGTNTTDVTELLLREWKLPFVIITALQTFAEEVFDSDRTNPFTGILKPVYQLSGNLVQSTPDRTLNADIRSVLFKRFPADLNNRLLRSIDLWSKWTREFELPRLDNKIVQALRENLYQPQYYMSPFPEAWIVAKKETFERLMPLVSGLSWRTKHIPDKNRFLQKLDAKEVPALLIVEDELTDATGYEICELRKSIPNLFPGYCIICRQVGDAAEITHDWFNVAEDAISLEMPELFLMARLRVASRITFLLQQQHHYTSDDPIDPRTGLLNPGTIDAIFEEQIAQSKAAQAPYGVLLLRIHTLRESALSQGLVETAMLLKNSVRQGDSSRLSDILVEAKDDALIILSRNDLDHLRQFANRLDKIFRNNALLNQAYAFTISGAPLDTSNDLDSAAFVDALYGLASIAGNAPVIKANPY